MTNIAVVDQMRWPWQKLWIKSTKTTKSARASKHGRHFKKCCTLHIDWKFVHEKTVRKMGAAFAPNGTKTASQECLNRVISDVSQKWTRFFVSIYNHEWNMGSSLHTWDEGTVKTMDWKKRKGSKEGEDSSICCSKVMASVFWNARGIIFIDYLQRGKTINGKYYANL